MKVINKFEEQLLKETNIEMQTAIVAALVELEMWSNTPCKEVEDIDVGWDYDIYVAQAADGE